MSVNINDLANPWWRKLDVSAYTCEVVANDLTSRSEPRSQGCCNLANRLDRRRRRPRSLSRFRPRRMPPSPSAHVVSIHPSTPSPHAPLSPPCLVSNRPLPLPSVTVVLQTPGLMDANPPSTSSTEVKDESVSVALRYERQAALQQPQSDLSAWSLVRQPGSRVNEAISPDAMQKWMPTPRFMGLKLTLL